MSPIAAVLGIVVLLLAAHNAPALASVGSKPAGPLPADTPAVPDPAKPGSTVDTGGGFIGSGDGMTAPGGGGYYMANAPGGTFYGNTLQGTTVPNWIGQSLTNLFGMGLVTRIPSDPNANVTAPTMTVDEAAQQTANFDLVASLLAGNEAAGGGRGF